MIDYITADVAADKWRISKRRVQVLCLEGGQWCCKAWGNMGYTKRGNKT